MSDTRRIARNTLFLYFRQILIMAVSLYTVRVVLAVLGAEDYGIYNVVAGTVTMLGFLSGSLASSFQRYLTFALVDGDEVKLKETFGLGLGVFCMLGVAVLVFLETAGLLFLKSKLIIPHERLFAAMCVYESSVISFTILIMLAPYQAMLLAKENMAMYAYASIVEAFLKLAVVWLLRAFDVDKLALYGFLLLLVPLADIMLYAGYCAKKYRATRTFPRVCLARQKEIMSYAGWNLLGSAAGTVRNQGINVLIGMFFPPLISAARGVANQVNAAVLSFSSNFSVALRPQIISLYAMREREQCFGLVLKGCRGCFFLLWLFALPLIMDMEYVLGIWLKNVPQDTALFARLVIIDSLIECLCYPLIALMHAHGRIREYQIAVGTIQILNIPVSYAMLRSGFAAASTMVVAIVMSSLAVCARVVILRILTGFPAGRFMSNVVLRTAAVVLATACMAVIVRSRSLGKDGFGMFAARTAITAAMTCIAVLLFGLTISEAAGLKNMLRKRR